MTNPFANLGNGCPRIGNNPNKPGIPFIQHPFSNANSNHFYPAVHVENPPINSEVKDGSIGHKK